MQKIFEENGQQNIFSSLINDSKKSVSESFFNGFRLETSDQNYTKNIF